MVLRSRVARCTGLSQRGPHHYYPHFKDEKAEAGGGLPKVTQGSRYWKRGLYSGLSGSKAHAFSHFAHITSGGQG